MRFTFLSFLLSIVTYAAAEPSDNNTTNETAAQSAGKNFYIRDFVYVPLRSGESPAYRIVHKGLKSGTIVTLTKQNPASGYSLVKTTNGVEGWIPSQYLMDKPTAQMKLATAEAKIKAMIADSGPMGEKLAKSEAVNNQLNVKLDAVNAKHDRLSNDYKKLQAVSSNAVQLSEDYQKQLILDQNNKVKIDTLTVENDRLKSKLNSDEFINGALVLFLAVLLILISQYFFKSRRRSEWR